jgi:hypothetical protein
MIDIIIHYINVYKFKNQYLKIEFFRVAEIKGRLRFLTN